MTTRILTGCALSMLPTLDAGSVQTCVTSPPYWGLRDYGVAGQLGLERTPDEYVARMVEVFRAVRRVLRDDGTLWLNLGDSYTGSGKGGNPDNGGKQATNRGSQAIGTLYGKTGETARQAAVTNVSRRLTAELGMKSKDLVGIPWRVAFALQADGWYLRSDIIWHKPNPMPESVTDRPTKAHEYLFLLSKAPTYYYDAAAIAEETAKPDDIGRVQASWGKKKAIGRAMGRSPSGNEATDAPYVGLATRNRRSVWTVATQPYSEAHFATFPPALIEPCILAGSSPQACEHCGAPWARVVERTAMVVDRSERTHALGRTRSSGTMLEPPTSQTTGWQPTCAHENAGTGRSVVLDPFFGAGTTGLVADRLGRDCVGVELNPQYVALAEARIRGDSPLFAEVSA